MQHPDQTPDAAETQPIPGEHAETQVVFTAPSPELRHAWRQRGDQLVCTSCPSVHAVMIQPGLKLVGIKDSGEPELVPRW